MPQYVYMQRPPRIEELIQEHAARRTELDAHGVYFLREITDELAEHFSKAILVMASQRANRPDTPITLYINSGGGSVGAGIAIIEMMERMRHVYKVTINTVVTGYAYSMGAIITQAGDKRTMGTLSTMMLHSGSWTLSGDADTIFHDYQKLATHYEQAISELFARRTGKHDAAWWRDYIYSGHERFLSANECMELGLVDEILTRELDVPATG